LTSLFTRDEIISRSGGEVLGVIKYSQSLVDAFYAPTKGAERLPRSGNLFSLASRLH